MASTDSRHDPRYAAQFQRGFDGPVVAPVQRAAVVDPTPSVKIERMPTASASAEERATESAALVEMPDRVVPRSEWALLALGVLALLTGSWLTWSLATDLTPYTSGSSTFADYAWQAARDTLAGPLFLAGFVGIAAWILVRAVRTGRRT